MGGGVVANREPGSYIYIFVFVLLEPIDDQSFDWNFGLALGDLQKWRSFGLRRIAIGGPIFWEHPKLIPTDGVTMSMLQFLSKKTLRCTLPKTNIATQKCWLGRLLFL